jgi:hypothetical protein
MPPYHISHTDANHDSILNSIVSVIGTSTATPFTLAGSHAHRRIAAMAAFSKS